MYFVYEIPFLATRDNLAHMIEFLIFRVDTYFIPLAPGLEGQIGELTINKAHEYDHSEIPIDCLVIDLSKGVELEEE